MAKAVSKRVWLGREGHGVASFGVSPETWADESGVYSEVRISNGGESLWLDLAEARKVSGLLTDFLIAHEAMVETVKAERAAAKVKEEAA